MKVAFTIAKNVALLAGKDSHGWHVVHVPAGDLTERQRQALATCFYAAKDAPPADYYLNDRYVFPEATVDGVKATLDTLADAIDAETARKAAKEAAVKANTQRVIDEKLTKSSKVFAHGDGTQSNWSKSESVGYDQLSPQWPYQFDYSVVESEAAKLFKAELAAANQAAFEAASAQAKENLVRLEREQADREAKELVIQEAKEKQIKEWVSCQGSANQQERFAAGLLPLEEVADAIRDEAFAPLNHLDRYQKITASEVCTCEYETCNLSCEVYEEPLTEHEWDTLKMMRELMGENATVAIKTHSCTTDECDNTIERSAAHVSVTVGAFTFSRQYAV